MKFPFQNRTYSSVSKVPIYFFLNSSSGNRGFFEVSDPLKAGQTRRKYCIEIFYTLPIRSCLLTSSFISCTFYRLQVLRYVVIFKTLI